MRGHIHLGVTKSHLVSEGILPPPRATSKCIPFSIHCLCSVVFCKVFTKDKIEKSLSQFSSPFLFS